MLGLFDKKNVAGPQGGNSTIKSTVPSGNQLRNTFIKIVLPLVGLAVLIVAGAYLYQWHKQDHHKAAAVDHQNYATSNLNSYSVDGSAQGVGMSFKLPQDFAKLSGSKIKVPAGQASFMQKSNNNAYLDIGGAQATTSAYIANAAPTQTYLDNFNASLKAHSNVDFLKSQRQLVAIILKDHFAGFQIDIQDLGSFTNGNIKDSAWSATFVIADSNKNIVDGGQMVYAITPKASYTLYVYSAYYNWRTTANQAVWKQVFDSLKIDQ